MGAQEALEAVTPRIRFIHDLEGTHMTLAEKLAFLKLVNRELPPLRDFRVGAVSLALSLLAVLTAAVSFTPWALAVAIVTLAVAIVKLLRASVQGRRIVWARLATRD